MRYVGMILDDDPNLEAMNVGLSVEIMGWVSEAISDVYAAAIFCSGIDISPIVVSYLQ